MLLGVLGPVQPALTVVDTTNSGADLRVRVENWSPLWRRLSTMMVFSQVNVFISEAFPLDSGVLVEKSHSGVFRKEQNLSSHEAPLLNQGCRPLSPTS